MPRSRTKEDPWLRSPGEERLPIRPRFALEHSPGGRGFAGAAPALFPPEKLQTFSLVRKPSLGFPSWMDDGLGKRSVLVWHALSLGRVKNGSVETQGSISPVGEPTNPERSWRAHGLGWSGMVLVNISPNTSVDVFLQTNGFLVCDPSRMSWYIKL